MASVPCIRFRCFLPDGGPSYGEFWPNSDMASGYPNSACDDAKLQRMGSDPQGYGIHTSESQAGAILQLRSVTSV